MTAKEVRGNVMPKRSYLNEINDFSLDQIFERVQEYALSNKYSAHFYGNCEDKRKKELEKLGYLVSVYGLSTKQPMTSISWE